MINHNGGLVMPRTPSRQEKENQVLYLISQKLPSSVFAKYSQKGTVTDTWSVLVAEFMHKQM